MSYRLFRDLLFTLSPETSHDLALKGIGLAEKLKLIPALLPKVPQKPVTLMGIQFRNPVGLAAGLDKNADYIDGLAALGFGFIEVGTVTPRPQPGNPKPRLFRIPERQAIINRMGFNNKGVEHLLTQVAQRRSNAVTGINIGKNFDTPVDKALEDYLIGLRKVYTAADYVTVNISSPNTPGLRNLQFGESLKQLLSGIKEEQRRLAEAHGVYKPVAVKIAPDMDSAEIKSAASVFIEFDLDAVIATNTTLSRAGVENLRHAQEAGGLSGAPLTEKSTQVLAELCAELGDQIPVIAAGGVMDVQSARAKLDAGARLIQIYTGFIYAGPRLVRDIVAAL